MIDRFRLRRAVLLSLALTLCAVVSSPAGTAAAVPSFPSAGPQPVGLAYDGTDLFDLDNIGFRTMYRLDANTGAMLGSTLLGGDLSDLAYDGASGNFFVSLLRTGGPLGVFWEITPAGAIVNQFPLPFRGGAIAFDGTNIFIADQDSSLVNIYDRAGTVVRSFTLPGQLRPAGFHFEGSTGHLWMVSEIDDQTSELTTNGRLLRQCDGVGPNSQDFGAITEVGSTFYIARANDPIGSSGTIYRYAKDQLICRSAADLSVTATSTPSSPLQGEPLEYSVVVHNDGPFDGQNVTFSDSLPAGVSVNTIVPTQGSCFGTTAIQCSLGDVPVDGNVTITISVAAGAPGPILNSAVVDASSVDLYAANNSATTSDTILPAADLSLEKTANATSAYVGDGVDYTLVVTNHGPSTAQDVAVADDLPAGVTYGSVTSSQGSCAGGASIQCGIGGLAAGAHATVTVHTTAAQPGTAANTASATSDTADPHAADNTATAKTTILGKADLSVVKTGPAFVLTGAPIEYAITVHNNGPSDAGDVVVTDQVPANAAVNSSSAGQGSCANGAAISCAIGTIAAGASVTVTVSLTATTDGTLNNSASAISSTYDPDTTNNSAQITTVVSSGADLALTESASAGPFYRGSTIQYTLAVTNNGPAAAASVVVTDTLANGVTLISSTPSQGSCDSHAVCSLGTVGVGQTVTVVVSAKPTVIGVLNNSAGVVSATNDPDATNNAASATVTVVNRAPSCGGVTAGGPSLWPPNHKLILISASGATDPDGDPVTLAISGITQDEPLNYRGDGNTLHDAMRTSSPSSAYLRAERSGGGDGRVYRVDIDAADSFGGSCRATALVNVPHDQNGPAVDSGGAFNSFGT